MTSIDPLTLLGDYHPSFRILYATVANLRVARSWNARGIREATEDPLPPIKLTLSIVGTATLQLDSLAIINSDVPPTKQFSCSLTSVDDWEAHRAHWRRRCEDGDTPAADVPQAETATVAGDPRPSLVRALTQLETSPPSLFIQFRKADWTFGNENEWLLHGDVPQAALAALAEDIDSSATTSFRLSFTLVPTLVDDRYAPPSVPVTFGILRLGPHSSGSSYGWIDDLTWDAGPVARQLPPPEHEGQADDQTSEAILLSRLNATVLADIQREIGRLATETRTGFILVFISLLLIRFLK